MNVDRRDVLGSDDTGVMSDAKTVMSDGTDIMSDRTKAFEEADGQGSKKSIGRP